MVYFYFLFFSYWLYTCNFSIEIYENIMKKLLLILFISSAFISSANANSIKGAFGFKLGYPVSDENASIGATFFNPEKPLPPLNEYFIETTLNQNLVYRITARHSEPSNEINECFRQSSWDVSLFPEAFIDKAPLKVILNMLEAKYGRFDYDNYRKDKDTNQSIKRSFQDGQRSIVFRCTWIYKRPAFYKPYEGNYNLSLTYTDWALKDLYTREFVEREKQKTLNSSSDYDI